MKKILLLCFCCVVINARSQEGLRENKIISQYLQKHQKELDLSAGDINNFIITDNYISNHNQVRHVHISQTWQGIKIDNATANIAISPNGEVVHMANRLTRDIHRKVNTISPSITPEIAIANAISHLNLPSAEVVLLKKESDKKFLYKADNFSLSDIPVELVFWKTQEEEILLAWSFSAEIPNGLHWYNFFVDAVTGEVLNKIDWMSSCDFGGDHSQHNHQIRQTKSVKSAVSSSGGYNVFALPVESPNHGERTIEISPSTSASPFGWHDTNGSTGSEYTIARGNNVHAYEDHDDSNIPGYSPSGGVLLNFDFPLDLSLESNTYLDAAITNLFYVNNRIHDILYQYGFDEQGGNFQSNNYGNGGLGSDYVLAEAQDGGGMNNANFGTPPDGSNPRMQMYLWLTGSSGFNVNEPEVIAGNYSSSTATFGPQIPEGGITADLLLAVDNTGPDFNDACETLLNANQMNGKIVVINRGTCLFVEKVWAAQNEGAEAVVIINNVTGAPISMGGDDIGINIPSIMISQEDGELLLEQMNGGETVNATLSPPAFIDYKDCAFDNGIVIHEYGHGISNRLTGGPSNVNCLFNEEQMGEGWSDWFATMLTMNMDADNPVYRPMATFSAGQDPLNTGIRPAPYDTSFAVNPYTYADVSNTNNITEPHGIGFIWASMLWDLTWAFIEQYGYDPDIDFGNGGNNMIMQLVVDGLKLQPCAPGFVDGRDAILLADEINNGGANKCMIWEAFARRGLGFSANQGSSFSRSDQIAAFDLPPDCETSEEAPIAAFESNVLITCDGMVEFNDLSANSPNSWSWNFGDGQGSDLQNPSHQFLVPGEYTITLVVENSNGADEVSATVVYEMVNFSVDIDGNSVSFTNLSQGISGGTWDFGDGSTSNELNPVHVYDQEGTYEVVLTSNSGECSFVESVTIGSSGMMENEDFKAQIFPNPGDDLITLSFNKPLHAETKISVYSADGKFMFIQSGKVGDKDIVMDISSLPAAVYFLQIQSDQMFSNVRMVVK